ncbi:MAG: CvpA family protein [Bdellovibrionales bacterium]
METQHSGINMVDIAVFGVILVSGLLALWRGFVREFFALLAWAGAAFITVAFYPALRPWMHQRIETDFAADLATGAALFCGALVVLIPIGYVVSGLVRGRALTAIDRSLGFVFGVARGALLVCLLFLITLLIWPEKEKEPKMLAEARTRPFLAYGAEAMKNLLPEDDVKKMSKRMKEMEAKGEIPRLDQPPVMKTTTTAKSGDALPGGEAAPAVTAGGVHVEPVRQTRQKQTAVPEKQPNQP